MEQSPEPEPGPRNPPDAPPGPGPLNNQPVCEPGMFESSLDQNGNNIPGGWECVDETEAARRREIRYPSTNSPNPRSGGGGPGANGTPPAGRPNYGPAPQFDAPNFSFGEEWVKPTMADAENDPGYQFALQQGSKALQMSAAARGHLLTGGTMKDIDKWGQDYATQRYGDVFNRNLTGYNTRFGKAKDTFDRNYAGAKDEFGPRYQEWLRNAQGTDLGYAQNWYNYWKNNLSVQDIFGGP